MLSRPRPRRKERRCILWRKWTGSSNRNPSCPLSCSIQTLNAAPARSSSDPRSPTPTLPPSLAPTAPSHLYPSPTPPPPKANSAGTICPTGRSCPRTRSLACARATRPVGRNCSTSLLFFDLSILSHVQRSKSVNMISGGHQCTFMRNYIRGRKGRDGPICEGRGTTRARTCISYFSFRERCERRGQGRVLTTCRRSHGRWPRRRPSGRICSRPHSRIRSFHYP